MEHTCVLCPSLGEASRRAALCPAASNPHPAAVCSCTGDCDCICCAYGICHTVPPWAWLESFLTWCAKNCCNYQSGKQARRVLLTCIIYVCTMCAHFKWVSSVCSLFFYIMWKFSQLVRNFHVQLCLISFGHMWINLRSTQVFPKSIRSVGNMLAYVWHRQSTQLLYIIFWDCLFIPFISLNSLRFIIPMHFNNLLNFIIIYLFCLFYVFKNIQRLSNVFTTYYSFAIILLKFFYDHIIFFLTFKLFLGIFNTKYIKNISIKANI